MRRTVLVADNFAPAMCLSQIGREWYSRLTKTHSVMLASACPVIATNSGGLAELVDPEVGALINPINQAKASTEIFRLLRQIIA
jgi:hypothetical protein